MGGTVPDMETKRGKNARQPTDWSRCVAAQIRAERAALGLNQKQGYQLAGVPKNSYIAIESGTRPVDVAYLAQISDAYGLPASTLVLRAEVRMADVQQREILASNIPVEEMDKIIGWRESQIDRGDDEAGDSAAHVKH